MPKVLGSVNPLVSDPLQHVTKERFKESRRPKNVSFYANGRPQIKGLNIRITPNKYNTFNELLKDLQRNFKLPFGVRRVYTPVNGSEICDIEDMDDGQTYLCASFERFRKAHYGQNTRPEWGHGGKAHQSLESYLYTGQPGGIVRGGGFRHAARNDKAGVRLKPLLNSQHLYESPKIRRRQHDQATGKENAPLATTWGTAPRDKFVGSIGHRGPRPGNIVPLYQATRKIRVVSDYDPTVSYDYLLDSSKVSSYDALLADISANLGYAKRMKEDMKKLFSLEKSREIRGIRDLVSLSAEDTLVGTSKEVLNEKTLRAICNAIQVYKHAKSTPSKHDSGFSDGGVDSPGFDSRPRKMEADKHKKDQYARIKYRRNDIDHEDLSQQEKELARLHHRKKERERREREKIINQENEKNQNERRRRNLKLRDSDRKRRSDYVDGSQSPVRSNEDLLPNAEHHERLRRKRERKRQHLQSKPTRADLIENSLELDDKYHSDAERPLERDLNDAEIAERERRKKDDRKRSKDLNNFKDSMRHKRQADKEAEKHRIERKENTEDTRLNKDDEDQISAQRSEQLRKLRELEREREYMRKTALKAEEEAIKQKKKTAVSNINAGEIADEEERLAARAERERQKAEKANAQSAQQEAVLEAERVKKKKADNLAKIREEELAEAERRRKQKEEEDRAAAEAEERRKREKAAEEEKQRLKDLQEEQDRIAAEAAAAAAARATKQRQEEEKQRQAAEAAKAAEAAAAAAKAAAERRAEEEKEKARKAAEEAKKAEEARIEEEKRKAEEEKRKAEEEKRKAEEARRKAEEEERQRKEAAKRKAEEEARQKEKNRPMGLVLPLHEDDEIARKYDLRKKVGDGNFANVFHATLKQGDPPPTAPPGTKDFAIKQIDKSKVVGKVSMLKNEIEIMKSCDHPNICKLYEAYETDKHVYLVMEHVQHGDLFDAISENVKFDEVQSALIIKNLSESLDYLHSRKIVHRDIKPENILVEKDSQGKIKRVKLADFGLAMHVKEKIHAVCGTPTYVAPEILAETGYGLEVDNWAAGVIAYILLCGFPPFRSIERNQDELFDTIQRGEFEYLSPYWDNVSDIAKDLIDQLLVVESRKRMKAKEIQKHKFIALNTNKE